MTLTPELLASINDAEQRALATCAEDGTLNVVPVSAHHVIEDAIVLCDFFMDKTVRNLNCNGRASLALWKGFSGIQVKGAISYEAEGDRFDVIHRWAIEKFPDRTLQGVLVLVPEAVFDLTLGNRGTQLA